MVNIQRGGIFLVNLNPIKGKEQGKTRPCLIIQNDILNKYSPITIIAPLTSKIYSKEFSTNVMVSKENSGLDKDSTILLNQIRAIDKSRVIKKLSILPSYVMEKVNSAIKVSLDLN